MWPALIVTPFRPWNVVFIYINSEVLIISGYAAMLTLTVEHVLPIVTLGRMLMYWCRANFDAQRRYYH